MSGDRANLLRGLGIVALIALAIVLLPGGGEGLDLFVDALTCLFLAAIATTGWRLYNSQQFWLNALSDTLRATLYGAIAVALFAIAADPRFETLRGGGLLQIVVLVGCGGAVYWVWRESRRYVI